MASETSAAIVCASLVLSCPSGTRYTLGLGDEMRAILPKSAVPATTRAMLAMRTLSTGAGTTSRASRTSERLMRSCIACLRDVNAVIRKPIPSVSAEMSLLKWRQLARTKEMRSPLSSVTASPTRRLPRVACQAELSQAAQ